ncbi:MAG: TetR family transcriptional regulator C-terminal domain-containing protein [Pseudomonadota bacterium]
MSEPQRKPSRRRINPEERRRQIIEATIDCLAQRAPEAWSLRQVAREIGVAPSLITYFFETWGELLLSAYKMLAARFEAELRALEGAGLEPRAHLAAIVDRFLCDDEARGRTAGAYIALWAFSQNEPALRHEMSRFSETVVAALGQALEAHARALGRDRPLGSTTRTLYILLDGLWYEMAVNPEYIGLEEARRMAWSYIDGAVEG